MALLTLDIRDRGLVTGNLQLPEWHSSADSDGLRSELWLLAYESTKKGWWLGRKSSSFIESHQFFGDIWRCNVEFYDKNKGPRKSMYPTFVRSPPVFFAGMGGQYP